MKKITGKFSLMLILATIGMSCFKGNFGVWLTKGQESRAIGTACYLLKIANDGLNEYKKINGCDLLFEGKYFVDSIKSYLPRQVLNVCCDDNNYNNSIVYNNKSLSSNNCYLCVTVGGSPIVYRYNNDMDYPLLYWVGLNFIDEYGKGDDIVYNRTKECNP